MPKILWALSINFKICIDEINKTQSHVFIIIFIEYHHWKQFQLAGLTKSSLVLL